MVRYDPVADRLFDLDERLRPLVEKGLMQPLSSQELRNLYQKQMQTLQGPGGGLSPVASGVNLPIAGFQGSNLFPNASGVATSPNADFNSPLNPMGQPMSPGYAPQFQGQQSMLAQGQPGGWFGGQQRSGFTTNIQIGEDGQVSGINLKRALQKRLRGQV